MAINAARMVSASALFGGSEKHSLDTIRKGVESDTALLKEVDLLSLRPENCAEAVKLIGFVRALGFALNNPASMAFWREENPDNLEISVSELLEKTVQRFPQSMKVSPRLFLEPGKVLRWRKAPGPIQ